MTRKSSTKLWCADDVDYPDERPVTPITVYEGDAAFTGLLDADGNPLYRVRDRAGFVRWDE